MSVIVGFKQLSPEQLERLKTDPSLAQSILFSPDEGESKGMDLDVAWEAIHFLLTGRKDGGAPPLASAILGGKSIGPDLGMGPARYLTSGEVKTVADALSRLSKDDLRRRFDLKAMKKAKIYKAEAWNQSEDQFEQLSSTSDSFARTISLPAKGAMRC